MSGAPLLGLAKYTAIPINVVGSKHEAKRQDRKFTWDFYE